MYGIYLLKFLTKGINTIEVRLFSELIFLIKQKRTYEKSKVF